MYFKIILLNLAICSGMVTYDNQNLPKISNQIVQLRAKLFPHCNLVFNHDGYNLINQNILNNLFNFQNFNYFSIYFGNLYSERLEYKSWTSVNKHNLEHCTLVILSIFHIENKENLISSRISQVLTPNLMAISRKDQDKFIFLTFDQHTDTILVLNISRKIKFKLVIGLSEHDFQIKSSKSLCFYSESGRNQIVHINLIENTKMYDIFPDFVVNFYSHQLRISSPTRVTSAIEIEKVPGNSWRAKRGHQVYMLLETQRVLNFTFVIFPGSGGGGTGTLLSNGSWNGCVGDLVNDRADIAMITGQIYARFFVIGFNFPFIHMRLTFIVGRPQPTFSWRSIWWAFTWEIWTLIVLSLLVVFIMICIIPKILHFEKESALGLNFINTFGKLFEQSYETLKEKSLSIRIVCIFWLFTCLILGTGYRSKLLILLAFPNAEKTPADFPDLVDSDFTWAMEGAGVGGAAMEAIRSSSNPTYQKLAKSMQFEPNPIKCLLRGFKSKFACIAYREQLRFTFYQNFSSRSRKNPFVVSTDTTFYCPTGWAIQKRSIIGPTFDKIILAMLDIGVVNFWRENDYESVRNARIKREMELNINPIIHEEIEGPIKLSMGNFRGAFNIIVLGLFLTFLIFSFEKIISIYLVHL